MAAEAPILAERLGGGVPASWEAVAGVPYGWRARSGSPGLFRLGDQAAVIASLAGDGIAIALTSGEAAARSYLEDGAGASADYQRTFSARAARPIAVAEALRHAAERRIARSAMMSVMRLAPGLARLSARLTRIA